MSYQKLLDFQEEVNLVPLLDADIVGKMGMKAKQDFQTDDSSLATWRKNLEKGRKLFRQDAEAKMYPFANASNVKYPLLTTAAIQFAARAYPAIVDGPMPVKAQVVGADPEGEKQERAFRISKHMSWQLLNEMTEWESDTDRSLHTMAIDGSVFKKVYFDPILGRNVSGFRTCDTIVVNKDTADLASCPRITEIVFYYPYEIQEKVTAGIFSAIEGIDYEKQEPVEFLEQHCRYDLDGDGYPEPYIITVRKDSGGVARIVANYDKIEIDGDDVVSVTPTQYFVQYPFIPDPEGGFYGIGFSQLLAPMNDSVNSILNQLIDAGHLANTGGGFMGRGIRMKSGTERIEPGEWKKVDIVGGKLADNIMALPIPQPSQTLFQLLGLLIDAAKEISSVQDVMTGGGGTNTTATTVLAQIEQGMKVFTAIYKRIHRSFKTELKLLFKLNSEYLEDEFYYSVMDEPVGKVDYEDKSMDVIPVSDPSLATDMQKMAKVQAMQQFGPTLDQNAVAFEALRLMNIADPEKYAPKQQPPSIEEQKLQSETALKQMELDIKRMEAQDKALELASKTVENISKALSNMADTDEKGADNFLNTQELAQIVPLLHALLGKDTNEQAGTTQGMVGQSGRNPVQELPPPQQGGVS